MMVLDTILLIMAVVYSADTLDCYSCRDNHDLINCNTTQRCHDGQACFHNTTTGNVQVSSLGCIDYQQCGVHGHIQSAIVGREIVERQASDCFECCTTDECNKHLCEHLQPSVCIDDESIDCAKMNTLFSICSDIDHAKSVCPKFCGLCNVVDGNWSPWSSWSQCDITCENGTMTRTRSCTNPAPKNGGHDCQGTSITTKPCQRELCPIHGGWSAWQAWGSCSTSCDMGLQSRTRKCTNPVPARNGQHCFGHNLDVRQCMTGPCANGGWSDWGNWNPCSVTCGVGVRTQARSCTNPSPSPYGKYCVGEHFQLQSCETSECEQTFCKPNPCVYGRCYDVSHDYLCVCSHGYEGRNCSVTSSHCQPDPCVNGTCIDMLNDFFCTCQKGFDGRYCNISTSACKSSPCLHGHCYDGDGDYICACHDGYRGKQCNISIDYCLSSPCVRGTCVNSVANFTCLCPSGATGWKCEIIPASDCNDILKMNLGSRSGIYWVKLWKSREYIQVMCDLETADGGWTVFQLRFNGSEDFYRNFANYTVGFGNLSGEFWLGLHNIYEMTSQGQSELRIDVMAADGTKAYEIYQSFNLSPGSAYTLHIGTGTGTAVFTRIDNRWFKSIVQVSMTKSEVSAKTKVSWGILPCLLADIYTTCSSDSTNAFLRDGDSGNGLSYHSGYNFYTYDHDNVYACASSIQGHGGWWFGNCATVNMNGDYITPGTERQPNYQGGIIFYAFQVTRSLKLSKMMFRRNSN